jgi:hypothetical protein
MAGSATDPQYLQALICLGLLKGRPEETLAGVQAHRRSMVRTRMEPSDTLTFLDTKMGFTRFLSALTAHLKAI